MWPPKSYVVKRMLPMDISSDAVEEKEKKSGRKVRMIPSRRLVGRPKGRVEDEEEETFRLAKNDVSVIEGTSDNSAPEMVPVRIGFWVVFALTGM